MQLLVIFFHFFPLHKHNSSRQPSYLWPCHCYVQSWNILQITASDFCLFISTRWRVLLVIYYAKQNNRLNLLFLKRWQGRQVQKFKPQVNIQQTKIKFSKPPPPRTPRTKEGYGRRNELNPGQSSHLSDHNQETGRTICKCKELVVILVLDGHEAIIASF